jgi:SAM-dependent methyltransferase
MTLQERRRTLLMSTAAAAVAGTGLALAPTGLTLAQEGAPGPEVPKLDVPFVPTPQEVVDRMLALAKVNRTDTLYDLGCGDGRIVVTAASQFGARGVGIDLNPERIAEAQTAAKKAGVEQRVSLRVGDLFDIDLSPATVVSLYLLPDVNLKLRPQLWSQLKPGARVVSHAFDMGPEWPPEQTVEVGGRTIYLWTITAALKNGRKASPATKSMSKA